MSTDVGRHSSLGGAIVTDLITLADDLPASVAVTTLVAAAGDGSQHAAERASCAVVLRAGQPVGILTTAAALAYAAGGGSSATVATLMSPFAGVRAAELADARHAARLLREGDARHLVVLDESGAVAGLITPTTLLAAIEETLPGPGSSPLTDPRLVQLNQELEQRIAERTAALERSEARLRKSETHLLAAQRIALLGSWEFDVASGEIIWSAEVYRMFGRDPALGPPLFEELLLYYHVDDREHHRAVVDQSIATAQPYSLELRLIRSDGELRHIQARGEPVLDDAGALVRLVGTVLDISERKLLDEERRNLADRLSLAVRSGAIGIWDWDVTADRLTWDQRMFELYGLAEADFSNAYAAWVSGLHPEDRDASEKAIRHALSGEHEFDTEFRVVHPDGAVRDIKAYGLVQRDASGQPVRMIGINFDITERKRAERRLREASAQLAAANRELEAFAYSVSHDLRAPLRAVDGFSKALVEDFGAQLPDEAQGYLGRIRAGVQRMGQLIDDLLLLSRVSRGEMQATRVDLSRQVRQISAELQSQQPRRLVEWVVAPDVWAWADLRLIRIAMENLLANAWKFTGHHEHARIEFGVRETEGGRLAYFVRDDGAGFNPAHSAKLFGVFQRLHDGHEFPGTGIGLATVQRVISRHGGQIWAEGAVEQGATFFFTLSDEHGERR